jgi:hypothetical protein
LPFIGLAHFLLDLRATASIFAAVFILTTWTTSSKPPDEVAHALFGLALQSVQRIVMGLTGRYSGIVSFMLGAPQRPLPILGHVFTLQGNPRQALTWYVAITTEDEASTDATPVVRNKTEECSELV